MAPFSFGKFSTQGWWYYFPLAFLVKTPTATLTILLAFVIGAFTKKMRITRKELPLLSTLVILSAFYLWARVNVGLRHILIVYPLLFILLGQLGSELVKVPWGKWATAGFIGALALEVLSIAPDYLSFFNRLVGGPEKGIYYLSDSNIDWGQDLNGLARFIQKEGNPELLLSYFGTGAPIYYGLQYQSLPTGWSYPYSDHVNSAEPSKEYIAVSVTNLQGTYFAPRDLFAWLLKKEPLAKIGYSIYVYDITNDLESQERIFEIYRITGRAKIFPHMEERIRLLKKKLKS